MDPNTFQWMMSMTPEQLEALRAQTQAQNHPFQPMGSQFPPFSTQFQSPQAQFSSPQSAFQPQYPPQTQRSLFQSPSSHFQTHQTHSQTPSQLHSSVGEQDEVDDEDNVAQDSAISPNKKGNHTWSPEEDEALVKAYMDTSEDALNGTNQKERTFWATVLGNYNGSRVGREERMPRRPGGSLKGRWTRIQRDTQLWVGCLRIASKRAEQSGYNGEEDMLKECHRIFFADNKKKFVYEHAYRNLRMFPKWEQIISSSVTGN